MTDFAFRTNWRGQLILRVLKRVRVNPYDAGMFEWQWFDARVEDLADYYKVEDEPEEKK